MIFLGVVYCEYGGMTMYKGVNEMWTINGSCTEI